MNESLLFLLSTVYCLATDQFSIPSSFSDGTHFAYRSSACPSGHQTTTFESLSSQLAHCYSIDPFPASCNDFLLGEERVDLLTGHQPAERGELSHCDERAINEAMVLQHNATRLHDSTGNLISSELHLQPDSLSTTPVGDGEAERVNFETLLAISRSECLYASNEMPLEQVW